MLKKTVIFVFVLSVFCFSQQRAIKSTPTELFNNPNKYYNNLVEIEGTVQQYTESGAQTTDKYLVKGDFGAIIMVRTSMGLPEVNERYRVIGIFTKGKRDDSYGGSEDLIIEQNRDCLSCFNLTSWLIGILAVILIVLIIFLIKNSRKKEDWEYTPSPRPIPKASHSAPVPDRATELYVPDALPTAKYIPGKFTIISKDGNGESYTIAGYPTHEGSIASIGKREETGERAYAHIQIPQKYKTVSRYQAEIIDKNSKIYIKNLSKVNFTQVNGYSMQVGDERELHPNDIIRMGELELKYELDDRA